MVGTNTPQSHYRKPMTDGFSTKDDNRLALAAVAGAAVAWIVAAAVVLLAVCQ